jgi:hypothetical protein
MPTWRSIIPFILAFAGMLYLPATIPPTGFLYADVPPDLYDWHAGREAVMARIIGGVLVIVCTCGCVWAFRRGSRTDKPLAVFAAVFTCLLAYETAKVLLYRAGS